METLKMIMLLLTVNTLLFSCNNSKANETNQNIEPNFINMNISDNINVIENDNEKASFSLLVGEDFDLFTDYYWLIADGRYLEDPKAEMHHWIGSDTPRAIFRKLEVPDDNVLYQERLRKERFTLMFHTSTMDKLYYLENSFYTSIFNMVFTNSLRRLDITKDSITYSNQNRVGEQPNKDYPLVGIWGELPHLTEYRIVDPADCLYYLEIDKEIPFWAVRKGTYLLKQIDDCTFETVTSFPDGHLRLEIMDERTMILRPLFTLPDDEEGLLGILILHRNPFRISEIDDIEF